ncbi:MAG: sigma-70 family RNA polymerase sigma factor [Calditrichaeota bacterium]|nr:sigma-70 family RNA polymerase sigma factor [Calditrichota bacterium]
MTPRQNRSDQPANPEVEKQVEALLGLKEQIRDVVNYHIWNKDNREDILQEIIAAAITSIRNGNFNPEAGVKFTTYVFKIVRNKITDYIKSQTKIRDNEVPGLDIDLFPDDPDTLSEEDMEELREALSDMLKPLKPKYREILRLRFIEGLSIEAISKILGLPPRRVSERIHYAIQKIRKKK